jgi:formylglycine-generating enzyme required for sulfatase activity
MGKWVPLILGILLIVFFLFFIKKPKEPIAEKVNDSEVVKVEKEKIQKKQMAEIKGGSFMMGSEDGDGDESPAHLVVLKPFLIDACEVTQSEYLALVGSNPSKHLGDQRPVDSVAWSAAAKYCNLRSLKEGFSLCYDEESWSCNYNANGYRLPTEAEWEYCYRAGTKTKFYFGSDPSIINDFAWNAGNSNKESHPVGQKKPNEWGLYDMAGNVCEWINDFYDDSFYKNSGKEDPVCLTIGFRLTRGGSFLDKPANCRSSFRKYNDDPEKTQCGSYDMLGFRCVRLSKGVVEDK